MLVDPDAGVAARALFMHLEGHHLNKMFARLELEQSCTVFTSISTFLSKKEAA
jgi:hypothetical protein